MSIKMIHSNGSLAWHGKHISTTIWSDLGWKCVYEKKQASQEIAGANDQSWGEFKFKIVSFFLFFRIAHCCYTASSSSSSHVGTPNVCKNIGIEKRDLNVNIFFRFEQASESSTNSLWMKSRMRQTNDSISSDLNFLHKQQKSLQRIHCLRKILFDNISTFRNF